MQLQGGPSESGRVQFQYHFHEGQHQYHCRETTTNFACFACSQNCNGLVVSPAFLRFSTKDLCKLLLT